MSNNEVYEFPATPTQQALWFIQRMDPASPAYHIPMAFRLSGQLNVDALRAAFETLVARHEILRTVFVEQAGVPVQQVYAHAALDWAFETASLESGAAALQARAMQHVRAPFDLERGPLFRVRLDRVADGQFLLVLVFHHIVVDHLSLVQLARELQQLYSKGPDCLPEQPLQFADYAVWQKEHLALPETEKKLDAWKQRLQGCSGVLDLPTDRPRPAVQTSAGAELRFALPAPLADTARQFARSAGVSLFLVMLSALKVLLQRYSGQNDVIVGTPFANRGDQDDLEQVVGCFINTLPIATRFDGIEDFTRLLASVKETMLEAFEGQDLPLEAIVDAVKPRRDPSYNPLFQVGFVLQEPPVQLKLDGLQLQDLMVHTGGAMYDLHVWMWENAGTIEGLVWYNTDLFDTATVGRFMQHYEQVLGQLTARPGTVLASVSLLTDAEQKELARWNDTVRHWPAATTLLDLIEAQARKTPDQIAIVGRTRNLTYAELQARASQLASCLIARGAAPGALVGIAVERDADLLVAVLGILKTGAAYVPLDPDYPSERLKYMQEQSGLRLLVTQSALLSRLPEHECDKVLIDTGWDDIAAAAPVAMPVLSPDLRMYVIFTSGSTGLPKGVQVSHGNVLNFLHSMAEKPGFKAGERLLAVTTLSFDIAVLELYLPLISGGTVVLAGREQAGDGAQLLALLEQEQVNVMQATPSTWRLLLGSGWRATPGFRGLCGGEAMPRDLAAQLLSAGVELWNMYGPTETTVWSTCFRIEDADAPILIGRPIANTSCYVLDHYNHPMPSGIPGELYIGGDGVTLGYLGRDDLTRERFVPNPWGTGLLYRTGDQVRFKSDGQIEYLNRIDNQVKVRGFRIELGEIEAVLARHPSVAEVAVLAREYSAVDKRLVAYVRLEPEKRLSSTELRRYLRDYLPDYMIPQMLVEVDAMPLTPNGKIDRKALPDPLKHSRSQQQVTTPRTDNERRLAAIWAQVLGTSAFGVESNFFEVGGHSLLATQVMFLIEREFGVRVHIRDLILNSLEQVALTLPSRIEGIAEAVVAPVQPPESAEPAKGMLGRLRQKLGL